MQARFQEKQRLERLQQLQREAEARQQALQRRQEEERRHQEEERRREEEWAKLTPFERDLLSVRQGRGGQEELAAIVRRIDEFPEQENKQLALGFGRLLSLPGPLGSCRQEEEAKRAGREAETHPGRRLRGRKLVSADRKPAEPSRRKPPRWM